MVPSNAEQTVHDEGPVPPEADATSWPCKMNGCSKVFAREADLKRHQRTTRSHSVPSFLCPQCDANFTRADALRRHQKSRHNGVVIEPPKQPRRSTSIPSPTDGSGPSRSPSMAEPEAGPSRSQSEPYSAGSLVPRVTTRGNYYREHTMSPEYGGPPPLPNPNPASQSTTKPNPNSPSTSMPPNPPNASTPPTVDPKPEASSSSTIPAAPAGSPAPVTWPVPVQWTQEGGQMPPVGFVYPVPMFQPSPYYRFSGPHMMPPYPIAPLPPDFIAHYPAIMVPFPATMFPQFVPPPPPPPQGAESPSAASPGSEDADVDTDTEGSVEGPSSDVQMQEAEGIAAGGDTLKGEGGDENDIVVEPKEEVREQPMVQSEQVVPPEVPPQETAQPPGGLTEETGGPIIASLTSILPSAPVSQIDDAPEHDSDIDAEGEVDMGTSDDLFDDYSGDGDALMLSPGDLLTQESLASPQ